MMRLVNVAMVGLVGLVNSVFAMPNSGSVVAGTATVVNDGKQMEIRQSSGTAIINWQGFSIDKGEKVAFFQPSSQSVSLNRVVGHDPSAIFGQMTANGKIFLVNPSGILFAPGSTVNTGGLVASTMNISNEDFLAGRYVFTGENAAITNQGLLQANKGGFIVVLAPQITNSGVIVADAGMAALGAGRQVTLNLTGDGLIKMSVDTAAITARIENQNRVQANGGQILLQARAVKDLAHETINHSGIIEADTMDGLRGRVLMDAGQTGTMAVSGRISAIGQNSGQAGGDVAILGNVVTLNNGTTIDASGQAAGGSVLIGGNRQGHGPEMNAMQTTVADKVAIKADAMVKGNGGDVVVWSDGTTRFQGTISAQGGAISGNGGQAEVSGKQHLEYAGVTDLRAAKGRTGTLLLDPDNIYVGGTGASGDLTISGATLSSNLNTASVNLQADNDILISDNVTVATSGNGLTLKAGRSVIVDDNVQLTTTHGNVAIVINDETAGAARIAGTPAVFDMRSGSRIATNGGNISVTHGTYGGVDDGAVRIGTNGAAAIAAGGGSIQFTASSAFTEDKGISVINNSRVETTGGGSITLQGIGKPTGKDSGGVNVSSGAIVSTENGTITIVGTARGDSANNQDHGIEVNDHGVVQSTGNGSILLTGNGGNGTDSNYGVLLDSNGNVQVTDGSLTIIGNGKGSTISNHGVLVRGANVISSGSGAITIQGKAGNGTYDNFGIQIDNSTVAGKNGNINLKGTGMGTAYDGSGIVITGSSVVRSTGTGASAGNIIMTGTAGGGDHDASGIWMPGGTVQSADGAISMNGNGGSGTGAANQGIHLEGTATIQSTTGHIALTGMGGNGTDNNNGVWLNAGTVQTTNGNIVITGTGQGMQSNNNGIRVDAAAALAATGQGNITLMGTGSGMGTQYNRGVVLNGNSISSGGGTVIITGNGGGTSVGNQGVYANGTTFYSSTGTGNVKITGNGGHGSGQNDGVAVSGIVDAEATGSITVTGTKADSTSKGIYSTGTIKGKDMVLQADNIQGGTVTADGMLTIFVDAFTANSFDTPAVGNAGIVLQPYTAGKAITIGGPGGTTTELNIVAGDLNNLMPGAGKPLQIGGNQTGNITVAEAIAQSGRDLVLQSASDVYINDLVTADSLSIVAGRDIGINTTSNAAAVVLTSNRDIYINAPVNMAGTAELRGSAGNNVFHISSHSLDGLGTLEVKGLGGQDTVYVDDAASSTNGTYTIASTGVDRLTGGSTRVNYQGISHLTVKAGSGQTNTVNSQLLTGMDQVLSGGNSSASVLNVDCHGMAPVVTATKIQVNGYGTIYYDGFLHVNLINLPTPTLPPTSDPVPPNMASIPYPHNDELQRNSQGKNDGEIVFVSEEKADQRKKQDGSIIVVGEGIRVK